MSRRLHVVLGPRGALPRRGQRGFVMMIGLILLVVVTLLSVSMFRSFGLQEKVAGNTREKQRALEAAQSALQYGEWWLLQGSPSTGVACTGAVNGNIVGNLRACSSPLATPNDISSWATAARIDYTPPGMNVNTSGAVGGMNAGQTDIMYRVQPSLYIEYVGSSDIYLLYRVSALGYGGNDGTAAVIQSTFQTQIGMVDPKTGGGY